MAQLNHPPSFDETIMYESLILSNIKIPEYAPMIQTNDKYWNKLQQRNQCSVRQVCKMLAVLKHTKADRKKFLDTVNATTSMQFPKTNTILDNVQLLCQHMNNQNRTIPVTEKVTPETFTTSTIENIMSNIYMLDVQISIEEHYNKLMHETWKQKLEDSYWKQFGKKL